MGWGYGINALGREIGYTVPASCDEPRCNESIDRGLAYVCGGMHDGGDYGCGGYFCGKHLSFAARRKGEYCGRCLRRSRSGIRLLQRLSKTERPIPVRIIRDTVQVIETVDA
jgi:hypothetical protein